MGCMKAERLREVVEIRRDSARSAVPVSRCCDKFVGGEMGSKGCPRNPLLLVGPWRSRLPQFLEQDWPRG